MLSNGKVFYKILSNDVFVEVQFLGEKKMTFLVKAEQYPEKLKIMDMLKLESPYLELPADKTSLFDD